MDTDGPSAAAADGGTRAQQRPSASAEPQPAPSGTGAEPLATRTNLQQQQRQQAPGTKVSRKKFEHVKVRAAVCMLYVLAFADPLLSAHSAGNG